MDAVSAQGAKEERGRGVFIVDMSRFTRIKSIFFEPCFNIQRFDNIIFSKARIDLANDGIRKRPVSGIIGDFEVVIAILIGPVLWDAPASDKSLHIDGQAEAFDAIGSDKQAWVWVLDGENALPHGELGGLRMLDHEEHGGGKFGMEVFVLNGHGLSVSRGGHA